MPDYRLTRFQDTDPESNLFDVEVVDAVNRFGRHALAYIDDEGGGRSDTYPRGTGVEIEVDPDADGTWQTLFKGFVMEADERNQQGADELVLEIYSFDHFLRRNDLARDFSSQTISSALEDVIKDFTPVSWVAGNVTVVNDETLTRSFRGEKVDNAISEFAAKSANEEYGVNDDIEFFFRPRETERSPRDIASDEWFDYDFPEHNAEALNELQLFFGEGSNTGSVIVDRGSDKQAIEDSLGLAGPATFREEVTREEIDNRSDAREKADEILNDREPVQIGEVDTYGLFDAEPGDLINVDIPPQGIDGEFRIAELRYQWGTGITTAKLVENRGVGDEGLLIRQTDTLDRVEARPADRDATATRYVETTVGADLTVSLTVVTRTFGTDRFNVGLGRDSVGLGRTPVGLDLESWTSLAEASAKATNTLLDAVRDGWSGDGNPSIGTVAIGDDGTAASASDTALGNQTATTSASPTVSGTKVVEWNAALEAPGDVQEAGLLDGSSNLHARAVLSSSTTPDGNVDVRLQVTVSEGDRNGVVTNDGQESVRDIIADDSPDLPSNIAFGSDDTMPTQSDSALGTEVTRETIDEFADGSTGLVDVVADIAADTQTGATIAELGQTSNGDLLTRSTFAEFTIESSQIIEGRDRTRFANE